MPTSPQRNKRGCAIDTTFLTAIFALFAAIAWGSGDFTGGLATRRVGPFRTVLISYAVELLALVIVALAYLEKVPPATDLMWGVVAGLSGMIGIGFLFRGFATGRMGIVAPVSAVLAAGIPVIFNAFTEGVPGNLKLVGFAIALVGIWLLSRPEHLGGHTDGLGMAVMAGLGFGAYFITLDQVSENAVFWPLVVGRATACAVMITIALATHRPVLLRQSPLGLLALAGLFGVTGTVFFLLAVQTGRLDIAAVLGSLYPAVTALLAQLTIKEHLTRPQVIGVAVAVLAIALITI